MRTDRGSRGSRDLRVGIAQALHQHPELLVVGLNEDVALRAQVCRSGQPNDASLLRWRRRIEAHGGNRFPKSLQQLLEVQQRDPDQTDQDSRQSTAKPTDLFRILTLREVDPCQVGPQANHTVVLKSCRSALSLVHLRHRRAPFGRGAPELRRVHKEVSRCGDHEIKGSAYQHRVSLSLLQEHMMHAVFMKKTKQSFVHQAYLDAYHPRLPGPIWDWMKPFVLHLVRSSVDDRRRVTAERTLGALTGYLDWARQKGLITSPEQARNRELVDLYTSQRASSVVPIHASRERTLLLALFDVHDASAQFHGLNLQAEAPYSESEIGLIRAWATYQTTPKKNKKLRGHRILRSGVRTEGQ